MRKLFRDNGLSIVLLSLFLFFWAAQSVAGHREHNSEQREHGQPEVAYFSYLQSAHFWEATAENWESEFFQMYGYVILTAFLYQKGSSESKKPGGSEPVDRDPRRSKRRDAPWPVRRGGLVLKLYENSLSLAFLFFFLVSITLHAVAGAGVYKRRAGSPWPGGTAVVSAVCGYLPALVRVVPELAKRISGHLVDGRIFDFSPAARVSGVKAGRQPPPPDRY